MKNSEKKIYFRIKTTYFFKHFQIKCKSLFISNLQSIKSRQLIKFRKIQNRKFRNNTCLRNQFVLFSTKFCLKNRSNYYTNCFMFSTKFFFSFSYFFVFFRFFFLFSHSFRSFSLHEWIVLTFINKLFRSLIVSILNLSLRDEIEKKRKINCSNIQSRNIKNSNFQCFTLKITYKIKKKLTIVCSFVSSIFSFCNIYIDIWINIIEMFAFFYCDIQYHIKINEKIINFIFSNIRIKTSKILFHYLWFDSHVSWKV